MRVEGQQICHLQAAGHEEARHPDLLPSDTLTRPPATCSTRLELPWPPSRQIDGMGVRELHRLRTPYASQTLNAVLTTGRRLHGHVSLRGHPCAGLTLNARHPCEASHYSRDLAEMARSDRAAKFGTCIYQVPPFRTTEIAFSLAQGHHSTAVRAASLFGERLTTW